MPISRCMRCNATIFEVVPATVRGTDRPMAFIQCAGCGTVVTAIEREVEAETPAVEPRKPRRAQN